MALLSGSARSRSGRWLGAALLPLALGCPACAMLLGFEEAVDASAEALHPAASPAETSPTAPRDSQTFSTPLDGGTTEGADSSTHQQPFTENTPPSCSCEPDPPMGWRGPIALLEAPSGAGPLPCSGDYAVEIALGRSSPNVPAAQCGCSCGAPGGASCGVASISYYSDGACGQPCTAPEPFATSTCVDAKPAIGRCLPRDVRSIRILGGNAIGGSCSPQSSVVLPPVAWGAQVRVCTTSTPPPAGTCVAGAACPPPRSAPFAARRCVAQTGDLACPTGYPSRTVTFVGASDTRSCSACGCSAPSGVRCSVTASGFRGPTCDPDVAVTTTFGAACTTLGNAEALVSDAATAAGGTCAPTGGEPLGTVEPTEALTICCE